MEHALGYNSYRVSSARACRTNSLTSCTGHGKSLEFCLGWPGAWCHSKDSWESHFSYYVRASQNCCHMLAWFFCINVVLVYGYTSSFQKVDDEEYGGVWELVKEGFVTSFAGFLSCNRFVKTRRRHALVASGSAGWGDGREGELAEVTPFTESRPAVRLCLLRCGPRFGEPQINVTWIMIYSAMQYD
ncbi:hypothetical protein V5799_015145 [Amblyomma americanum]|uniref:Uncharacterized protein n=1 Tax=Amblyomma americanum TaxID=6943 RepID=A0AAQ4E102_AMBAM